jgi:tetratricopeptide (TPR) repeat protein
VKKRDHNSRFALNLVVGLLLCGLQGWAQSGNAFDRGVAEFRAGHYQSAVTLFAEAEKETRGATDALLYQAKALVHLGDFAGAEQALRGYVSSHEDSSDAFYLLGFVLNRENRPADSLAYYTKGAAITRPTGDDLKIVGLDYVLLDDYADAIKWLEKSVEFDPKNKDAWYFLGRAYYTTTRLSDAHKAFDAVLNLDPHDVRAENNLGLVFESSSQPAAAIEAYRKAIAWQANSLQPSEQPYVNLGSLLMEQGRTADAEEPLEKAAALAPNNSFCHLTLGVYYRKIGRLDDAQRELERATKLDPENAVAHYQLGRLYRDIHAMDQAQAESDRAQAKFDRAQAEFDRAQAELDRAQAEFDRTAEIKSRSAAPKAASPNP